jgi:hypothetical protein
MKLWIFGDSFSDRFSGYDVVKYHDSDYRVRYHKWKGYSPLSYGEVISKELGCDIEILSSAGASNTEIFHTFISKMDEITEGDLVIVNWTYLNRFRIANDNNEFDKVMIQAGCKSPNSLVNIKSLEEIGVNRNSHTIYYKEVSDYSKVIKKICNNKIYTFIWTFMNHSEKMDKYIKEFYDEVKSINNLETITKETLGIIVDGHYSEYAHQQLADEILKNIKLWKKTKKKQSSN